MIVRRVAVFSGFDARVVEKLRPQLTSQQTDVVVVKYQEALDEVYFEKLVNRFRSVMIPNIDREDIRLIGILVSCLGETESHLEWQAFFPMLRRMAVDKSFRRDINRADSLGQDIIKVLTNREFLSTYERLRPAPDAVLALPLRNASSPRLKDELSKLYRLQAYQPARALDRFVQRLRGGRGLRSRDLDFCGRHNSPRHPVRRVTDSVVCDLRGRFRLGFSLPSRFEFDVSCSKGLEGKTFELCDGEQVRIPASATHLNMRINDDFGW